MLSASPWIVTKTEFARLLGVSQPMVSKLVSNGKLGPGLLSDGRIDVGLACRNAGYPDPRRVRAEVDVNPGVAGTDVAGEASRESPRPWRADDGVDSDQGDAASDEMQAARLLRLQHQARQAELDTAEREGRLVDRAAVEQAVETKARQFRDAMLAVPARIADECARLMHSSDIEFKMTQAIEDALMQLEKDGDNAV